jgi:urease accessory protein
MEPGMGDLALLRLLQVADSSFPSGAYTLSHGLETLVADGLLTPGDGRLAELIGVQLLAKLARSDLVALLAAHDTARNAGSEAVEVAGARIVAIDRRLAAVKTAADDRRGSERVGRRLAAEVSRLAPGRHLVAFAAAAEARTTPGNAAVALGLAGEALGIDRRRTVLAAASTHVTGLVSAAIRLGLIGHAAGQGLIAGAGPVIVAAADLAAAGDWRNMRPSAPQMDVALARHERAIARSFAS